MRYNTQPKTRAITEKTHLTVRKVEAVLAPEALAVPQRQHVVLFCLPASAPLAQRDGIVGPYVVGAHLDK